MTRQSKSASPLGLVAFVVFLALSLCGCGGNGASSSGSGGLKPAYTAVTSVTTVDSSLRASPLTQYQTPTFSVASMQPAFISYTSTTEFGVYWKGTFLPVPSDIAALSRKTSPKVKDAIVFGNYGGTNGFAYNWQIGTVVGLFLDQTPLAVSNDGKVVWLRWGSQLVEWNIVSQKQSFLDLPSDAAAASDTTVLFGAKSGEFVVSYTGTSGKTNLLRIGGHYVTLWGYKGAPATPTGMNSGVVSGNSSGSGVIPIYWSKDGIPQPLNLGNDIMGAVNGVTETGVLYGYIGSDVTNQFAVVWPSVTAAPTNVTKMSGTTLNAVVAACGDGSHLELTFAGRTYADFQTVNVTYK